MCPQLLHTKVFTRLESLKGIGGKALVKEILSLLHLVQFMNLLFLSFLKNFVSTAINEEINIEDEYYGYDICY